MLFAISVLLGVIGFFVITFKVILDKLCCELSISGLLRLKCCISPFEYYWKIFLTILSSNE